VTKAVIVALAVVGGAVAYAQTPAAKPTIATEEDYSDAMKDIAAQNTLLRKALGTPSEGDALAAANRLEASFKKVLAFWESKKVEDASVQAAKAVATAQDVAKSLQVHDIQGATAALQTLAGTCMNCHGTHRARLTDGFYKIK
jgi:cytochrome c556